ncbi:MAG: hypothetical protein WD042_08635 [Phycisphaeraceae bacterium]
MNFTSIQVDDDTDHLIAFQGRQRGLSVPDYLRQAIALSNGGTSDQIREDVLRERLHNVIKQSAPLPCAPTSPNPDSFAAGVLETYRLRGLGG